MSISVSISASCLPQTITAIIASATAPTTADPASLATLLAPLLPDDVEAKFGHKLPVLAAGMKMRGAPLETVVCKFPLPSVVAFVHETSSTRFAEFPKPALLTVILLLPELTPRFERTESNGALEITISVDVEVSTLACLVWKVDEAFPAADRIPFNLVMNVYIEVVFE